MQQTAGNGAVARLLQRAIRLGTGPSAEQLTADQSFQKISVFIKGGELSQPAEVRTGAKKKGRTVRTAGPIRKVLEGFAAKNRHFDDVNALADALEQARPGSMVDDRTRQALALEEFGGEGGLVDVYEHASGNTLPVKARQALAAAVEADAQSLLELYRTMHERMESGDPVEGILSWFSQSIIAKTSELFAEGCEALGVKGTPFAVVALGSAARGEMYPTSDVDVDIITEGTPEQVRALYDLKSYVNGRLKAAMRMASDELGVDSDKPLPLNADKVIGETSSPEEFAQKALAFNNTAVDATVIFSQGDVGQYIKRFVKARKLGSSSKRKKHALEHLGERLVDFRQRQQAHAKKPVDQWQHLEVKEDLLRPLSLALRELSQFFDLKATTSWDRIKELVKTKRLGSATGDELLQAMDDIAELRTRVHLHYGYTEEESVRISTAVKARFPEEYTLSASELQRVKRAHEAVKKLYEELDRFKRKSGKTKLGKTAKPKKKRLAAV
jgi:predicted nucleotidyltransferase